MRHRFHSICPYFAMFPESFVESWIQRVVPRGATVLDPFCGRGTTPFQALLMGRRAVACDISPVAYCLTRAKTNAPVRLALGRRLTTLERNFEPGTATDEGASLPEFFHKAFHPETLAEVLYLRRRLNWKRSDVDCMLAALALGSLHGDSGSQYYFSNQMPRTISPKPAYSVRFWERHGLTPPRREVFKIIRQRIGFRYASGVPDDRATVYWSDMRDLPSQIQGQYRARPFRYVITSPPYFDITNLEEDQWLRLWFLGNGAKPTYGKISKDNRHSSPANYWGMICDLWRMLGQVLGSRSQIVLRIGGKDKSPAKLRDCLLATSQFSGRRVRMIGNFAVSPIRRRQTDAFRPGSKGCLVEVDFLFEMA